MIKTDEHFKLDEQERHWQEIEDILVENVRFYWIETRKGPHDECMCHDWYVSCLRDAIRKLRSWRTG